MALGKKKYRAVKLKIDYQRDIYGVVILADADAKIKVVGKVSTMKRSPLPHVALEDILPCTYHCCQLISMLALLFRDCIYLSSVVRVALVPPARVAPSRGARGRSWCRRWASFVATRKPLASVLQQGV